jgi:hypothetical protein
MNDNVIIFCDFPFMCCAELWAGCQGVPFSATAAVSILQRLILHLLNPFGARAFFFKFLHILYLKCE